MLLSLLEVGCKRNTTQRPDAAPPRPVLADVVLADVTSVHPRPARLDLDKLRAEVRVRALASGLFDAPPPSEAGSAPAAASLARLRLEVAIDGAEVEARGSARVAVHLRLDTRPSDAPGALAEDVEAGAEQIYPTVPVPDRDLIFARLVVRTVGDLLETVAARLRLQTASAASLHAALRSDGGELREEAIRVVGRRGLREEVPALLDLLNDPEETVRDSALGALLEMKEARAVPVLTKTRSFRDRREMRKIIEAIAILGGQEALDYLSFVAGTHDDPEIKAMAQAAHDRIEGRLARPEKR